VQEDVLTAQLEKVTQQYIKKSKLFRNSGYDLSWLLENNQFFWPAYQTINLTGNTFFEKLSNMYFGKKNLFKKKIINKICYKLNEGYFTPLKEREIHIDNSDFIIFWNQLSIHLNQYWSVIHHWTYTELFSFLTAYTSVFCTYLNLNNNFYKKDKILQNQFGRTSYIEIRSLFIQDKLPLKYLLYLVVKSNWIDNYNFDPSHFILSFSEEINDILDQASWVAELIDSNPLFHFKALENDIHSQVKTFLYECDNSGEIYFDLVLIEYLLLNGHNVIVSLKKHAILNDITYQEFKSILKTNDAQHLSKYVNNGTLSLVENDTRDVVCLRYLVNEAYKEAYKKSNIIILKGQGHFESYPKIFISERKKTPILYKNTHYHLFGVKSEHTLKSMQSIHKYVELNQFVLLR
tara:strand:+ start:326 stop:1540 length:1215 start_codon:yes stop_codon:yes gene_type:complete